MTRVVSLFLPTWPTDRVRRKSGDAAPPREAPLVLIGHDGKRRAVLAADEVAQAAGLRIGMPATKAQVLVPDLIVQDADPEADNEALERLALWMLQRYAPIVAADPPDGIVIDTTGADHHLPLGLLRYFPPRQADRFAPTKRLARSAAILPCCTPRQRPANLSRHIQFRDELHDRAHSHRAHFQAEHFSSGMIIMGRLRLNMRKLRYCVRQASGRPSV